MIACAHAQTKKNGKDRFGNQRYKCCLCGKRWAEERHKQLGEMKILLATAPMPNPQAVQMAAQLKQHTATYAQTVASGQVQDAGIEQGLQQMQQQVAQLPPMISSVQIDPKTDNHEGESAACLDWINGAEGRRYKNGTQQEREAFMNVHIHWEEHETAGAAQKAAAAASAIIPPKPPTKSIPVDKLPPAPAADALRQAGIKATPQDFAAQDAQWDRRNIRAACMTGPLLPWSVGHASCAR